MSDSVTPWTIAHQVPLCMEFSRILEWVAISCSIFSKLNINKEGHVGQTTSRLVMSDSETPWTVAHQAPLSMGLSRQEYWSGLPCPPPGDLPDPGIEPASLMSPALGGGFFTTSTTWETLFYSSPMSPLRNLETDVDPTDDFFSWPTARVYGRTPAWRAGLVLTNLHIQSLTKSCHTAGSMGRGD